LGTFGFEISGLENQGLEVRI